MAPERRRRVLMVLESAYSPKGGGGAESQVRTLARYMRRHDVEATVLTPLLPRASQLTAERSDGVAVGRIRYPRWPLVGAAILAVRLAIFLFGRGRRYEAWHVHIGHHIGALTCLVGAIVGKPVVVKISGWWELEQGILAPGKGLVTKVERAMLKLASAFQAISTRIAGELAKQGFRPERIVVLPNGVDMTRFGAHRAGRAPGAPFTAVFVGRLVPEKGLETLVAAWAAVFAGRTDARLQLVGTGRREADLRADAERLGIAAQVEFLGHRDDVEAVLANADVGMLPSTFEGLSNTLLEFMAAGLPTIASRVSGSEDFVVDGRNGWLFDVGDQAALAACLSQAVALPPERLAELGKNARADVEARAAVGTVVSRLLALYAGARPDALAPVKVS